MNSSSAVCFMPGHKAVSMALPPLLSRVNNAFHIRPLMAWPSNIPGPTCTLRKDSEFSSLSSAVAPYSGPVSRSGFGPRVPSFFCRKPGICPYIDNQESVSLFVWNPQYSGLFAVSHRAAVSSFAFLTTRSLCVPSSAPLGAR